MNLENCVDAFPWWPESGPGAESEATCRANEEGGDGRTAKAERSSAEIEGNRASENEVCQVPSNIKPRAARILLPIAKSPSLDEREQASLSSRVKKISYDGRCLQQTRVIIVQNFFRGAWQTRGSPGLHDKRGGFLTLPVVFSRT